MKPESHTSIGPEDATPTAVPVKTGAEGSQARPEAGTALVPTVGATPFDQRNLGAVLGEHVDVKSRTVSAIALAAFQDAHQSREILRQQYDRVSDDCDSMRERFHDADKRAAVLVTKIQY